MIELTIVEFILALFAAFCIGALAMALMAMSSYADEKIEEMKK